MSRTAAIVVCALFAVIGSVTCSPFDTTEASIGSGSDAGPIWTTSDGGTPDGGTGSSDGGTATSDGGGGGVGTGGGAGGGASAACEGIVPGSNPPQQSAVIPHGSGQVCWFFASDEAGNVAAESHSGSDFSNVEWKFWAPGGGGVTGTARAGVDLFGEPSGFESTHRESGSTYLVRWSGSGAEQNRTLLGGPGCNGEAFLSLQKGSLVLGGCSGGALMASIFDVDGKLVASRAIADRFTNAVGAVDSNGRVIVVAWPGSAVGSNGAAVGRWFDSSLNATTDWFGLPADGNRPFVRPLIGGGVAVQSSNGSWVAVVGSNQAGFAAPPQWLASNPKHDFMIVRQGRAYALIAKDGSSGPRGDIQLFDASGNACGTGRFAGAGLAVGHDGTVIASSGSDGCTMAWWSGALR